MFFLPILTMILVFRIKAPVHKVMAADYCHIVANFDSEFLIFECKKQKRIPQDLIKINSGCPFH